MPGIDERPYKEFIDGRIETKMSPQKKHSLVTLRLLNHLLRHAEPRRLGLPFPELRCSFAGRSLIPDIAFLLDEHIETDEGGEILDPTLRSPDIHIEIVSPEQSARKCREKLVFSTNNGCPLGWLIDPIRKTVHVFRPGQEAVLVPADGALEGDPVLPGYRLPVAEVFGWVKLRRPRRKPAPPSSPSGSPTDGGPGR